MYKTRTVIKVVGTHALIAGVAAAIGTVVLDFIKLAKADVF